MDNPIQPQPRRSIGLIISASIGLFFSSLILLLEFKSRQLDFELMTHQLQRAHLSDEAAQAILSTLAREHRAILMEVLAIGVFMSFLVLFLSFLIRKK